MKEEVIALYRADFVANIHDSSTIKIRKFEVIKHTDCGVWIK